MNYAVENRIKALALIVDDDASLRISMQAALHKAGFDVIEESSCHDAIPLFKKKKPHPILHLQWHSRTLFQTRALHHLVRASNDRYIGSTLSKAG